MAPLLVTLLLILLAPLAGGASPSEKSPSPVRCLVLPPENLARSPSLGWLSEGLALAVSSALSVPGIEVVDRETRVNYLEAAGIPAGTPLSRASMLKLATTLGVDGLVFGAYAGTPEVLRVNLHFLDLRSLRLGPEVVATGALRALAQMENDLAWGILGQTRAGRGLAREEFRARTRSVPNESFVSYVRAATAPDPESRMKFVLLALDASPDFPEALALAAQQHYRNGDCRRTLEWLAKAPRGHTGPEARFMAATCQCRMAEFNEAIRTYESMLPDADTVEVRNNLAVAYMRAGEYQRALEHLNAARARTRADPFSSVNLAVLRQLQGDDHGAEVVAAEALRANPEHGLLHYLLYLSLKAQGAGERALAALAQAVRVGIDPEKMKGEDPRGWLQLHLAWQRSALSAP